MTDNKETYFERAYTAEELSNDDYHAETEHVTGSNLFDILQNSPAGWRFKEQEERQKAISARQEKQKPLSFGTTGHCVMLEPSRFEQEFFLMRTQEEFKDLLTTDQAILSWMKERGRTVEPVNILAEIFENVQKQVGDREQVPGGDYDKVLRMREVIMSNGDYADVIQNGEPEISLFCVIDGVPVKVRLDYVTPLGGIKDYKTTRSAQPEAFGRHAYDLGYWLKMALQHDCFCLAYGARPTSVSLLAQEKEPPFLALDHKLTPPQLAVGRMQYKTAIQLFAACKKADVWPSYANGKSQIDLDTPPYIKARFKHIFDQFEGQ